MTPAGSTQGASRVGALAVVVSAGASPFLAQTLSAITSQTCAPDVVLVVDIASRANGLGDGTPIEELVERSGLDATTAVRVVRAKEAKNFGDAVSRGLTAYAGLVAAGLHPNPVPHADVVSTTVHKTLGGPRSGMLLSSRAEQWGKKLNSAVFPGQQGGPLMHVIAAKAVAMKIAGTEEFRERQERTVRGAAIIAERLGADDVSGRVGASLAPIAGILLIVGSGGGFKQTLVDSGIAGIIAAWIQQAAVPALLAGWLVAVAVRLATGSATVATITAAGIMAPLASHMAQTGVALLVLAIGAGSVFLSHVNDAGFWLVKEYFGMTVGQTFKTWSLMETILSVVAMATISLLALALGVF